MPGAPFLQLTLKHINSSLKRNSAKHLLPSNLGRLLSLSVCYAGGGGAWCPCLRPGPGAVSAAGLQAGQVSEPSCGSPTSSLVPGPSAASDKLTRRIRGQETPFLPWKVHPVLEQRRELTQSGLALTLDGCEPRPSPRCSHMKYLSGLKFPVKVIWGGWWW